MEPSCSQSLVSREGKLTGKQKSLTRDVTCFPQPEDTGKGVSREVLTKQVCRARCQ